MTNGSQQSGSADRLVLLGRDHLSYESFEARTLAGGRTTAAISVGADANAQSLLSKGDPQVPNEDALLAIDEGSRVLLAVADAHFGCAASHELIEGLARDLRRIPGTVDELQHTVEGLGTGGGDDLSESTLMVAVFDRRGGLGFGIAFGDSSLVIVAAEATRIASVHEPSYVTPRQPWTLSRERHLPFRFSAPADSLLLAFTDGVDQCHYRSPETSIRGRHLRKLFAEVGAEPATYACELMEMALKGVDGHPGGQDNVALIVSATSPIGWPAAAESRPEDRP